LREKGIHIWDLFPCFLTAAHTKDDVNKIILTFRESVNELIESGFFPFNPGPKLMLQKKKLIQ